MAEQTQAETIFGKAIEIEAEGERNAFLDGACDGDASLRQQVEKLVHDYFRAGEFLEQPVAQIASPTIEQPVTEKPGTQIGPYKLLQQIGEGGMGVVYMAEQKEPVKRRVALKIIKPGMDTRQVIARFEAERQALAMMDHPNIAKVLDAGAADSGRPYFVMELVNGLPVTKYCDEQHLTPKERLELFVPICQAVQHAHQKGIIHRDLKPSNILVAMYDNKAVPKIIDFGVAKATSQSLTDKTMFTQLGQVVGTLEYMSPEQAQRNQLDIDTRSDIYSLGVVLYELLTGETPFDRARLRSAAFDEMLRIIREEEPSKPSTKVSGSRSLPSIAANRRIEPAKLGSMIRGELDWIVLKAMEKDRARRYETASKFAGDVQHYLNDEAVAACPPSAGYQFRKFVRRNRAAMIPIAITLIALLVVAVGSSAAAFRFEKLVGEKAKLNEQLQSALREVRAGLDLATTQQQRAETNLNLALDALDTVYVEAIGRERLMGLNPDSTSSAAPDLTQKERTLLETGLVLYEKLSRQNATDEHAIYQAAQASFRVGSLQRNLQNRSEAGSAYTQAIELLEDLVRAHPDNVKYAKTLGQVLQARANLGKAWNQDVRREIEKAIAAFTRAIELNPSDAELYISRGTSLESAGLATKAQADYLRALEFEPDSADIHATVGWFYTFPPHPNPALAVKHLERALALDPTIANLCKRARVCFMWEGDFDRAGKLLQRAVEIDPRAHEPRVQRAIWHVEQQQFEDALREIDLALQIAPRNQYIIRWRGNIYRFLERYEESLADFNAAERGENSNPYWLMHDRARTFSAMGRHNDAIFDIVRMVTLQPEDSFSWSRLEWACQQVTDAEVASEAFRVLCESPNQKVAARAHALVASIQMRLNQFEAAEASIDSAVRLHVASNEAAGAEGDTAKGSTKIHPVFQMPSHLVATCTDAKFQARILNVAREAAEECSQGDNLSHYAQLLTACGRYEAALVAYQQAIECGGLSRLDSHLHCLAVLHFSRGNHAEGSAICEQLLSRFEDTTRPFVANLVAWTSALTPGAVENYDRPVALATKAVQQRPRSAAIVQTLGSVLYRSGRFEEALTRLEESDAMVHDINDKVEGWYFLAMTHRALGHDDQAGHWLDRANKQTDQILADAEHSLPWPRELTLKLLRDETARLFEAEAQ